MRTTRLTSVFVLVVMLAHPASPANASVVITINQVGSGVVTTGSGTLNLTSLTPDGTVTAGPAIVATRGLALVGAQPPSFVIDSIYQGITGPPTIGPGPGSIGPAGGTGDCFGVTSDLHEILVPVGYVSGTFLTATDDYPGSSFLNLGLEPGTYTWTWGMGPTADSLTVQIGPATVPEPSTAILAAFGFGAVVAYCCSRHRQKQRRHDSA